jgi:uncharacterized protein YecE (DUF72 family)
MHLLTGTSGFSYKEWKPSFYPADLPAAGMLRFYGERFPTVEINNSFFRVPSEAILCQWSEQVPETFAFALKAPQQITHRKRLKEAGEAVDFFTRTVRTLGSKLGPILFQLPPNLKKDLPRLQEFLEVIPTDLRIAFEFRHPTWFEDDIYEVLRNRDAALCIAHGMEHDTPAIATASWGYLRLRLVEYTEADLRGWAAEVRQKDWKEAYVFFKHEDTGTGPALAAQFARMFRTG